MNLTDSHQKNTKISRRIFVFCWKIKKIWSFFSFISASDSAGLENDSQLFLGNVDVVWRV